MNDFHNRGTGWTCKRCERELERSIAGTRASRLLREGEAESKTPELSNLALAKWTDETRQALICPRCGVTELVDKF